MKIDSLHAMNKEFMKCFLFSHIVAIFFLLDSVINNVLYHQFQFEDL